MRPQGIILGRFSARLVIFAFRFAEFAAKCLDYFSHILFNDCRTDFGKPKRLCAVALYLFKTAVFFVHSCHIGGKDTNAHNTAHEKRIIHCLHGQREKSKHKRKNAGKEQHNNNNAKALLKIVS